MTVQLRSMRLLSIRDHIEILASPEAQNWALHKLSEALSERFDEVRVQGASIEATTGWNALINRGPRTHPMLGFDRLIVTIEDGDAPRLRFEGGIAAQLLVNTLVAAAIAIVVGIDGGGLKNSLLVGALLAAALVVLNLFISWYRGERWLKKTWNDAVLAHSFAAARP